MAGHSKWANIKFRKAAQDAKRGKIFTKIIRQITVAARAGGEIVESNPALRLAIDKALVANMKRDTINNAIKRGAGGLDGDNMAAIRYEGYGVGGVAVMVDCLTDNKNRTVAEVRHAFSKCGGNLGTDGSVAYLFENRGEFYFLPDSPEDKILELALDAGADDVNTLEDGSIEVLCTPSAFPDVLEAFKAADLHPESAELTYSAMTDIAVSGEQAEQLMKMIDMLEDLDDVQEVYSNADFIDVE